MMRRPFEIVKIADFYISVWGDIKTRLFLPPSWKVIGDIAQLALFC